MSTFKGFLLGFLSIISFGFCKQHIHQENKNQIAESFVVSNETPAFERFARDSIRKKLEQKIANGQALVAHIFVPLCDNDHQGIVPVNKSLGNGLSLKTNLYWGAGYGMKSHFKLHTDWKLLKSELDLDSNILERVVFYKKIGKAKVYLVADAYRGDKMRECLENYFYALAGRYEDIVMIDSLEIPCGSYADLLAFNGHNGLMDTNPKVIVNHDGRYRDAVVIACLSYRYFETRLNYLKAYPLVTTTNLMAPEAYVMEGIIDAWAKMKTEIEIKNAAGDAYDLKHSCSQAAARRLFMTGWD